MPAGPTFRAATPADAERIAREVVAGFETYRSFSPPEWSPPPLETETRHQRAVLSRNGTWCLLAEDSGRLVGQITFVPAATAVHAVADPALAHFRNLFVDRSLWGSGLAVTLHARALAAARDQGYEAMRLYTPRDHGRARRFYEREGWVQRGEPFDEPALGMHIVEYHRSL